MMTTERDRGFTLIELLLSVSLLLVIVGAVSGALITFLQNGTYALERDDHSGGASLLSTYLNRDLASADGSDAFTPAGTPCSGSGTAIFSLKWREWTASATAPSPAPNAGTWTASYVVSPDAPAIGGAARYMLQRRLCSSTGTMTTTLLRNLDAASASPSSVVAYATTPSTACGGTTLTVTLPSYLDDASAHEYSYRGCVTGRTS